MKKFILISLLSFVTLFVAQAQTPTFTMTGSDTVVNAATVNLDITLTQDYNIASFQLVTTKLTGTVAGTCPIQASNDGVNYFPINTPNWYGGAAFADTATITNVATFTYTWTENPVRYKYYRLPAIGSGTSTYIVRGYCQPRKTGNN
jgi:hypothetical protein